MIAPVPQPIRPGSPGDPACSDAFDASSPTACTTWRSWAHADVQHSRPVIVTYNGTPVPENPRLYQGAAGEGIAVDRNGNVFAGEGPNSMRYAGGPWTKYSVSAGGM